MRRCPGARQNWSPPGDRQQAEAIGEQGWQPKGLAPGRSPGPLSQWAESAVMWSLPCCRIRAPGRHAMPGKPVKSRTACVSAEPGKKDNTEYTPRRPDSQPCRVLSTRPWPGMARHRHRRLHHVTYPRRTYPSQLGRAGGAGRGFRARPVLQFKRWGHVTGEAWFGDACGYLIAMKRGALP